MGRNRGKNNDDIEQTLKELKAANRRLKSDNQRLKMELATLQEAFLKTSVYLKNNTDGISVEKIILCSECKNRKVVKNGKEKEE